MCCANVERIYYKIYSFFWSLVHWEVDPERDMATRWLFTSVLIDPALNILRIYWKRMKGYRTELYYQYRTSLSLWGSVCIIHTSPFKINSMNKLKEQLWVSGKAHSCQHVYGTFWERSSLVCLQPPPRYWFRFVDDTCVIQQQANKQAFLDHINTIDPAIKFTVEGNQGNGAIPFLDTLVTPEADNSLSITVYHKPTHTDQYLQWDGHHNLSAKYQCHRYIQP